MRGHWRHVVLYGLLASTLLFGGCKKEKEIEETTATEAETKQVQLNLWYTDAGLTDYLTDAAAKYTLEKGVLISLNHTSSIDYLGNINEQNIKEEEIVDLYVINSSSLGEAYLAGLTKEVPEEYMAIDYPAPAIAASTYHEKQIAYPLYYQTTFFLYNKNFIGEPPQSFQEIMDFAASYGGEEGSIYEGIESLLKWNVNDIFYDYGFFGAYLNVGGQNGDDDSQISIDNPEIIEALTFYKSLNQSMYFDAAEVSDESVIQEFLEGRLLYTIAGTQSLRTLESAQLSYGIAPLPHLNDSLESRQVATNTVVAVNPYAQDINAAEAFAYFLTDTYVENLYEISGYLPCKGAESYLVEEFSHIEEAYQNSVQVPKMMGISNFWALMEVAVTNIWNMELPEEDAGKVLSEESQIHDTGEDEIRVEKTLAAIRNIVKEQLNFVQTQIELQIEQQKSP